MRIASLDYVTTHNANFRVVGGAYVDEQYLAPLLVVVVHADMINIIPRSSR